MIELPLSSIGATVRLLASGIGDVAGPVAVTATVPGRSLLPLAPVHLALESIGDGDVRLRWVRRSRAGWRWIDGVDAPLGEEREAYRVTLIGGAGRAIETTVPELIVTAADRAAAVALQVRQIGSFGESPAAEIALPAL